MRSPIERIKDFREIWERKSDEEIVSLAADCHNCKMPFCEKEMVIGMKSVGCPLECSISNICSLVKYGLWEEAYNELIKMNPFPEFTSRVCKGLCEISCINNKNNNPVKIREVELAIIEKAFDNGWVDDYVKVKKYKKISIIGSGPSGLAIAYSLRKAGYDIVVYEKNDMVGGMLMYGIPPMKLDKAILKRRIDMLTKMGIEFRTGINVGKDISSHELLIDSEAVIISSGSEVPIDINVPGRHFKSVLFAKEYLSRNTKKLIECGISDDLATGKNVLVLGSGDTSVECIATAIRQKARLVATMDIKDMPPLNRSNPWPEYPNNISNDYAYEEARTFMGLDPRSYNITVKEIAGDIDVKQAKSVNVRWERSEGMLVVMEDGNEKIFGVDLIILALGYIGPDTKLFDEFKINHQNKRPVCHNYHTSNEKVFVCGDALNGPTLVPKAIKDGLNCAIEVMKYLK